MELKRDFLDYLISIDRSKRTLSGYDSDLDIFFCWNLEHNDNKYFIDLTKREIAKFQKFAMADWGWSTNRLARVKSVLSSMSNYVENILDDEVPDFRGIIRKVESPIKQPVRDKTVISNEEVQMILDTLVEKKKYQCACVFALAAFGGARKSELLRYKVFYFDDESIDGFSKRMVEVCEKPSAELAEFGARASQFIMQFKTPRPQVEKIVSFMHTL